MNQWWIMLCVALLLGDAVLTHHIDNAFYQAAAEKLANEQQQVTIAAEQGVIRKQQTAEAITNKTEGSYEKSLSDIDSQYVDGLHKTGASASHSLPTVSRTTSGACATPKASKTYRLTFRQCDIEEAKLKALWAWIAEQRK